MEKDRSNSGEPSPERTGFPHDHSARGAILKGEISREAASESLQGIAPRARYNPQSITSGPKNQEKGEMKMHHGIHEPRVLKQLTELIDGGQHTDEELAKECGIGRSSVSRLKGWYLKDRPRFEEYAHKSANLHAGVATPRGARGPYKTRGKDGREIATDKQTVKEVRNIVHLRQLGWKIDDIAKKLKMKKSRVNYRLYNQQYLLGGSNNGHGNTTTNGRASAGTENGDAINKSVFIGYAFCKVEQYIRFLAQGANVSETVLKQRLSKLLGHSPVREEHRFTD